MRKKLFLSFLILLGLVGVRQSLAAAEYSEPDLNAYLATDVAPVSGKAYFIKNIATGRFLTRTVGNNNFGTRACVAGYKSPLASNGYDNPYVFTVGYNQPNKYYTLWSNGINGNNYNTDGFLFCTDANVWVDKYPASYQVDNGKENSIRWNITEIPGEGYQIKSLNVNGGDPSKFFAPVANVDYGLCNSDATDPAFRIWKFYDATKYQAALALYRYLKEVEPQLAGNPSWQSVFDNALAVYNPVSSIDDLNRAIMTLTTVAGSSYVKNGGFDDGLLRPWRNIGGYTLGAINNNFGIETWHNVTTVYQLVKELPSGLYVLKAQAFRTGGIPENAVLYIDSKEVPLAAGGNIDSFDGANAFQKALSSFAADTYPVEIEFVNNVQKSVEIGIRTKTNNLWVAFDAFQLIRLGDVPSNATQEQLDALAAKCKIAENLKSEVMQTLVSEMLIEKTANAAAITSSNTVEEAQIAFDALESAISTATLSVASYANVNKAIGIADIRKVMYVQYPGYAEFLTAADQEIDVLRGIYSQKEKNDSEIITALKAFVNTYYNTLEKSLRMPGAGLNYTDLLASPDFAGDRTTGWTSPGGSQYEVCEFYNTVFNTYQTLSGLSAGTYELSLQAYFRPTGNDAGASYALGGENISAYLYAKSSSGTEWKIPLLSLYAETGFSINQDLANGYPNMRRAANNAFNTDGKYKANALKGIRVADGETLTIGIRMENKSGEACWVAFDNFRLAYTDQISLKDARDFQADQTFAAGVSYVRNFSTTGVNAQSKNGWQTLCLPFEVTSITYGERELVPNTDFWLFKATSTGYVAADRIEAHQPYLIAVPNDDIYVSDINISGDVTFSGSTVVTNPSEAISVGVHPGYRLNADYKAQNTGYGIDDYTNGQGILMSGFVNDVKHGAFWPYAVPVSGSVARIGLFGNDEVTSLRQVNVGGEPSLEIFTLPGAVELVAAQSQEVRILNMAGETIKVIRIPEGTSRISLTEGIYFVNGTKICINF